MQITGNFINDSMFMIIKYPPKMAERIIRKPQPVQHKLPDRESLFKFYYYSQSTKKQATLLSFWTYEYENNIYKKHAVFNRCLHQHYELFIKTRRILQLGTQYVNAKLAKIFIVEQNVVYSIALWANSGLFYSPVGRQWSAILSAVLLHCSCFSSLCVYLFQKYE